MYGTHYVSYIIYVTVLLPEVVPAHRHLVAVRRAVRAPHDHPPAPAAPPAAATAPHVTSHAPGRSPAESKYAWFYLYFSHSYSLL